jgi:6-phosphofructokinase 1
MGAYRLFEERANYPAFDIPVVCLPATIDNNLPGTELSIGADTALNNIVTVVDKIKQSAVAERRCYIVEVMGRKCGYLALMSGLATGAERVYLNEEGVTLKSMKEDLDLLIRGFREGKRLGLIIRNEEANATYDTKFISSLFEEESQDIFDVRESILGHLQQGGDPSPFDRIQATRLARRAVGYLIEQAEAERPAGAFVGMEAGRTKFHPLEDMPRMLDVPNRRPKHQWWLGLRTINNALARSGPTSVPADDESV